jgi:hypothetical protein
MSSGIHQVPDAQSVKENPSTNPAVARVTGGAAGRFRIRAPARTVIAVAPIRIQ